MIAIVTGTLAARDGETIVVQTESGVGYQVTVPAGVAGRLPPVGGPVTLHTELVVKEDGWALFGFDHAPERRIFQRLLDASGFGPKLALALLSALGAERTVRSIRGRDLAALSSVTGIGRTKAERLVLELRDRFDDVALERETARTSGTDDAVRALTGLGYPAGAAEDAVRGAIAAGSSEEAPQLIRLALQRLTARGGT